MKRKALSSLLNNLLNAGPLPDEDVVLLGKWARSDPVESVLITCGGYSVQVSLNQRLQKYNRIVKALGLGKADIQPCVLWSQYIPLADLLVSRLGSKHTCLIGIAGPPGAGKTSLTSTLSIIVRELSDKPVAVVSLDDFYLTPSERQSLGYKWRAVPGTHDVQLLSAFLQEVRSETAKISIPRYDTRLETRLQSLVTDRPRLMLFEGWFAGALVSGYELLSSSLDYLIYLDMNHELAYRSRLKREARIRTESNNTMGMSESETETFWREALLPGINQWVIPLRRRADLTLTIDEQHRFSSASCRDVRRSGDPSHP